MIPDSEDPREWLRVIGDLQAEHERALLWHAEAELDGEAAAIRRACEAALGRRAPMFVEVGDGQVLELDPDQE